ncbi:MAG TPA: sigma-70 family RNA polymerase sigma factor [Streptosporangiaceae bacterium]|nr:sigma-70 family RNA polymerase sigma factor [Streptosporangiaceae bacterium]
MRIASGDMRTADGTEPAATDDAAPAGHTGTGQPDAGRAHGACADADRANDDRAGNDRADNDRAADDRAADDRAADDRAADERTRARADFEAFVKDVEPRLSRALAAAYGFEDGRDATAEALAYAFEHWDRLQHIANLPGYLFRVGQSRGRRRRQPVVFAVPDNTDHAFEPGLPAALGSLTGRQRLAVVLVYGYGYTLREVAELTGIRPTTVQNHLARGLSRLRSRMGVNDED